MEPCMDITSLDREVQETAQTVGAARLRSMWKRRRTLGDTSDGHAYQETGDGWAFYLLLDLSEIFGEAAVDLALEGAE